MTNSIQPNSCPHCLSNDIKWTTDPDTICPVCGFDILRDTLPVKATYGSLLTHLQAMSAEELKQDATIHLPVLDEFFGIEFSLRRSKEGDMADGVLDEGHLYMEVIE